MAQGGSKGGKSSVGNLGRAAGDVLVKEQAGAEVRVHPTVRAPPGSRRVAVEGTIRRGSQAKRLLSGSSARAGASTVR